MAQEQDFLFYSSCQEGIESTIASFSSSCLPPPPPSSSSCVSASWPSTASVSVMNAPPLLSSRRASKWLGDLDLGTASAALLSTTTATTANHGTPISSSFNGTASSLSSDPNSTLTTMYPSQQQQLQQQQQQQGGMPLGLGAFDSYANSFGGILGLTAAPPPSHARGHHTLARRSSSMMDLITTAFALDLDEAPPPTMMPRFIFPTSTNAGTGFLGGSNAQQQETNGVLPPLPSHPDFLESESRPHRQIANKQGGSPSAKRTRSVSGARVSVKSRDIPFVNVQCAMEGEPPLLTPQSEEGGDSSKDLVLIDEMDQADDGDDDQDDEDASEAASEDTSVPAPRPKAARTSKNARTSSGAGVSSGNGKPFKTCAQCGKLYQTREGLRLHIRNIHVVDKRHQCTSCDRAFVRAGDLRLHIMRMHSSASDRPFPCSFATCAKSFACKSELIRHEKTHGKSAPGIKVSSPKRVCIMSDNNTNTATTNIIEA